MTPIFVNKSPFSWNQGQALDLFTIYDMVLDCHPANHAVSPLMITGIMYEETAFCNRVQQTTNGKGPAVGFGQMQIYDPEKKAFWDWMGYNNDMKNPNSKPLITPERVLGDNKFSVDMTCKYFQWLLTPDAYNSKKPKGLQGALAAQAGGGDNATFPALWISAEPQLAKGFRTLERVDLVKGLNAFKNGGPHPNPIFDPLFQKYWDFTLQQLDSVKLTGIV
jgi:hypothetical protein